MAIDTLVAYAGVGDEAQHDHRGAVGMVAG
jgi:hypothetical protein